jgi:hypothetical protein
MRGIKEQGLACGGIKKIAAWEVDKSMIKKVLGGYQVLSSKGKNMGGPYKTRKQALKRLRQVEFFKRHKG